MPKKTKEIEDKIENIRNLLSQKKSAEPKDNKSTKKAKTSTKSTSKNVVEKNETSKKSNTKKDTAKKNTTKKVIPKEETPKKTTTKKVAEKKNSTKAVTKKEEKSKKVTSSKSAKKTNSTTKTKSKVSKTVSSKSSNKKSKVTTFSPEYYDLPYRYNQTVVKILAQTPNNLFVYWEISDEDRKNLKEQYGEYFFEITKPVLVIHNETMNYTFELDINDFANSWYFQVNDTNCEYKIELGRRPIPINYNYMSGYDIQKNGPIKPVETEYIYISSSNELEVPNNHILFNDQNKIYFRNIKTNQIIEKDIKDFSFINKNNEFINIYELYKNLYKDEISNNSFDLKNPSSGISSSW